MLLSRCVCTAQLVSHVGYRSETFSTLATLSPCACCSHAHPTCPTRDTSPILQTGAWPTSGHFPAIHVPILCSALSAALLTWLLVACLACEPGNMALLTSNLPGLTSDLSFLSLLFHEDRDSLIGRLLVEMSRCRNMGGDPQTLQLPHIPAVNPELP